MRVVVNARFLTQQITGVQRFALEVSKRLRRSLHDVEFVSPSVVLHEDAARDLKVIQYGWLRGHLWEQIELPRFLGSRGNPILLNLGNTGPLRYGRQVVTVHDVAFLRNPSWFSWSFRHYYRALVPRVARRALMVITISQFSKGEIVELMGIDAQRVRVVRPAVEEGFGPDVPSRRSVTGDYVLAVSSFDPRKNLARLVAAFRALELPDVRLVIVGAASRVFMGGAIGEVIGRDGDVVILSDVRDDAALINLYRHARLFVYPSLYEGFGMPPLEAMACGCPTVVARAASLPEACGEAAYYVDPLSTESIAQGMSAVLRDDTLRQSLVEEGLRHVARFSWQRSADELVDILGGIVSP